ncbi:MAG TPA: hypothetical protein VH877_33485 [Polyangia bacterium]|jgi:hypothetical protein|nr:hypothetical protein [Polyangia bacterium]
MRHTLQTIARYAAIALALQCILTSVGHAQGFANDPGKTGPVMLNLKVGGAFGLNASVNQFALQLDAGFAVDRARRAYIVVPIQFQFSAGTTIIMIPVGFQYDFPLPVKGLYIYPRAMLGYAPIVGTGGGVVHAGVFAPEVGIKYVLNQRWNFGFEPFSLPVLFNQGGTLVFYRFLFYAGVNLP